MTGKQTLFVVAATVLAYSVAGIALSFIAPNGSPGSAFFGLIINAVIVTFLVLEHGWARWALLIKAGFSVVFSAVALFSILKSDVSISSVTGLWIMLQFGFSVALCLFLTLSKRVNEIFNPASGF